MSEYFNESAKDWDKKQRRVENAQKIATAIKNRIPLSSNQKILDFGTGTGLLAWEIAPSVEYILGVDTSEEMLKLFSAKDWPCKIDILNIDLSKNKPNDTFDGIISSMTLHHVENIKAYFTTFHKTLKKGGFLALADLETEDGSFHTSGNQGVYHLGFSQNLIKTALEAVGFDNITFDIANVIEKEMEGGDKKQFPIFLVTARKV